MKSKIFGLMILSIFVLVLALGAVSADFTLSSSAANKNVLYGTESVSFDVTVNNNGGFAGDYDLNWSASTSSAGSLTLPTLTTSTSGQNQSTSFKVTSIPDNFVGTINVNLHAKDTSGTPSDDLAYTITINAPTEVADCSVTGDSGDLMKLEIKDITVTGLSEDDNEWVPLDDVEVEVKIENNENDYKLKDINLAWGLYDLDKQEFVIDDEESEFTLKDGADDTLTLSFTLEDPSDFEDGDTYAFYVWAKGTGEESDVDVCRAVAEDVDVVIESDIMAFDNVKIEGIDTKRKNDGNFEYSEPVSCGSTLQLTADLWNVGSENQEDIQVVLYSDDMEISGQLLEIGDVNAFDSEDVSFEFTVPEGFDKKGWKTLKLLVQDDGDGFENDYTDKDAEFNVLVNLGDSCVVTPVNVAATLESNAKAGREMTVSIAITNEMDEEATYNINLADYTSWASNAVAEPATLVIGAGQTGEALVTLNVKKGVEGDQTFNVEVSSDDYLPYSQPVQVTIQKSLIGGNALGDNPTLTLLIIGIAIVLVIIIIVLAIRVARR